jgi:sRNA-binding regulator protein Hfq
MSDPVQIALQSETIKPPTIVINKEAKEKLVVRHSIKGSTLHLEKMSSAELREADASINNTSTNDKQADVSENDEPTDLLKQPLNDSGLELIDSIVNDGQKNETEVSIYKIADLDPFR